MVANLKKGMRVMTSGGIHGTITSLDESSVGVEIADKVKVKVARGNIAMVLSGNETEKKVDKK
jgi:preprotein translocase subunit YajC